MEIRLATALMFKKCPELRLDGTMEDSMMEMQHFFLAGPVGKHCNVTRCKYHNEENSEEGIPG